MLLEDLGHLVRVLRRVARGVNDCETVATPSKGKPTYKLMITRAPATSLSKTKLLQVGMQRNQLLQRVVLGMVHEAVSNSATRMTNRSTEVVRTGCR